MPIPGNDLKAGWGVLRLKPWHLAGVYASSIDAEKMARVMGVGYVVKYGDHRMNSQDFSYSSEQSA